MPRKRGYRSGGPPTNPTSPNGPNPTPPSTQPHPSHPPPPSTPPVAMLRPAHPPTGLPVTTGSPKGNDQDVRLRLDALNPIPQTRNQPKNQNSAKPQKPKENLQDLETAKQKSQNHLNPKSQKRETAGLRAGARPPGPLSRQARVGP